MHYFLLLSTAIITLFIFPILLIYVTISYCLKGNIKYIKFICKHLVIIFYSILWVCCISYIDKNNIDLIFFLKSGYLCCGHFCLMIWGFYLLLTWQSKQPIKTVLSVFYCLYAFIVFCMYCPILEEVGVYAMLSVANSSKVEFPHHVITYVFFTLAHVFVIKYRKKVLSDKEYITKSQSVISNNE